MTLLGANAGAARTNTQPISTKPSMPPQHEPKEAEAAIRKAQF
jgi:hypothetical protein